MLLGLAPGRSGACVRTWLGRQTEQFRGMVETVVIDPSAPYASAIRRALPHAQIAVDKWHLVKLGNDAVTQVRQRLSRQRHGRRGRKQDPAWAHRTLLLCAGDRLSPTQLARLRRVLATDDLTNEIGAAWGCKELLRQLLDSPPKREEIQRRLWRFYAACAAADMPETTRLATTVETWWPAILVALTTVGTNARTEGFNRTIKQVKRVSVNRPRIPQHDQLPMPHHGPHRGHTTA